MAHRSSVLSVSKRRAQALIAWVSAFVLLAVTSVSVAFAANPPPVQNYYVPVPENQVYRAFKTIYPNRQSCSPNIAYDVGKPIKTYISISVIAEETIVYYDHWEDDFEIDISTPSQATTETWGDGDPGNGAPPGIPSDVLAIGTVIVLENDVNPDTLLNVIDFDGGDKIGSTRSVAVTRATWANGSGTLLAGAVEVYDTGRWGLTYTAPVGENVAVTTKQFEYSGMAIMASEDDTTVRIDKNADGVFETTTTLQEGASYLVNGDVLAGAKVSADFPVQVTLITGDICEDYESRWYALFPDELLDDSYYSPVGTPLNNDGTLVFLHNGNSTPLTINWATVSGVQTPLSAPPGGTVQATIPNNSGAHFYSADGRPMSALAAVDATSSSGFNSRGDWGFTLVPEPALTAQVLVGWAPGQDPTKPLTENGSPVWVTPVLKNGASGPVKVCVDYNNTVLSRATNRPTDANNFTYDVEFTLNELESQKVFDPDKIQTGMALYVCDEHAEAGTAVLAVAWGQAPGIASRGVPGLDLGTTVPPASLFVTGKSATIEDDDPDDGRAHPGDTITYDVVIINASRFNLPTVLVSDTVPIHTAYIADTTTFDNGVSVAPIADNVSGTPFPLDEGGVTLPGLPVNGVYTVTFQVTVNDPFPLNVDRVHNQATVTIGNEIRRPEVETPVDLFPGIGIEKATNGEDANNPTGPMITVGDEVKWTYTVVSTGNTPVTNVSVTDNIAGINPTYVSGDGNGNNVLDPGETWLYEAIGVATEGQYANVGTATGNGPDNEQLNDTDPSHYFGVISAIEIEKSTNGEDADNPTGPIVAVGDPITWQYTVRNLGNTPLSNVTVTDDIAGVTPVYVSGDSNNDDLLDVDETWIYEATGVATAGQYANVGTAGGDGPSGEEPEDTDPSHYFGVDPAIDIEKSTNGEDADTPTGPVIPVGEAVTWRYTVTNPGNVALSNVSVTDNIAGITPVYVSGDDNNDDLLDLSETWIYEATGVATAGQYANIGTARGNAPNGEQLEATDPSHYFGGVGGIDIEKLTNGEDADMPTGPVITVGDPVTWTYTVKNLGNQPLRNVTVTDNIAGVTPTYVSGDANNDSLLDPDETWIYQATGVAIEGQYANIGTVTATTPDGEEPEDTDPSHYYGGIAGINIEKATNGEDADTPTGPLVPVGDTVTWTYRVSNTGNGPLSNVTVTDDIAGVTPVYLSGDANNDNLLDVDEVWLYEATGVAIEGQYANVGTATAITPEGIPATDTDPSHYWGVISEIKIVKVANPTQVNPGETVVYSYTVTNEGNSPLANIQVTDDKCSPVNPVLDGAHNVGDLNTDDLLDVTEAWRYTCSMAVFARIINTAVVTGIDVIGETVTDQDQAIVTLIGEDEYICYVPIVTNQPSCPPEGCPVPELVYPKSIAVHEGYNQLFITERTNNRLLVVNPHTFELIYSAPTGHQPWGVVINEGTNRAYVSNYGSGDVSIYDATTLDLLTTVAVGGEPVLMEILPDLDMVFVIVRDGSKVAIIEGDTVVQTTSSGGSGPYGITADPVNQRVYVGHRDSRNISMLSRSGGVWNAQSQVQYEPGVHLFELAYNPANEKLYSVYTDGSQWSVDVWKPVPGGTWGRYSKTAVGDGGAPDSPKVGGTGLEVNPSTGRVFNVNTADGTVSVIDGSSNSVIKTVSVGEDPFPIAVDSQRNMGYVGLRESGGIVSFADE